VTPAKPRAAQTAVKGVPATATMRFKSILRGNALRSWAIFSGERRVFAASNVRALPYRKICSFCLLHPLRAAKSSRAIEKPHRPVASCAGERHRQKIPWTLPPALPSFRFRCQVPSSRLTAEYLCQRRSTRKDCNRFTLKFGSRRNDACTGKSGANRHAKANVRP